MKNLENLVLMGSLLCLGASFALQGSLTPPSDPPVHVVGIPDPNDYVLLRGVDGPYTVPQGKLLIITGLGNAFHATTYLLIDGAYIALAGQFDIPSFEMPFASASILSIPPIPVRPGQVVSFLDSNGRATGYLAKALP
jgi:hypothetical protein